MVMVDTDIVCKAPVRLLISGMGDALATYFEARACKRSDASNCVGGKCTLAAMNLAQLCYDTLMENGVQAMIAAKEGICTRAVENVIEANTYLSGIGFESGGLAGLMRSTTDLQRFQKHIRCIMERRWHLASYANFLQNMLRWRR